MSEIIVSRSSLRSAIASVLPHAGKATDETPHLGKIRWTMTGEGLLLWATDYNTAVAALVDVVEYQNAELAAWDTTTAVTRKILAVFKASSTRDTDGDLTVQVTDEQLHITETGDLLPGEHLKQPKIKIPTEDDRYPDVARILHTALTADVEPQSHALVDWSHLAAFAPSVKAWGGKAHLTIVGGGSPSILVRAGSRMIGVVQRHDGVGDETRRADERQKDREHRDDWASHLWPLQRPVKVKLSPFEEEDLTAQALAALAENGPGTHFRVVPVALEPEPDPTFASPFAVDLGDLDLSGDDDDYDA